MYCNVQCFVANLNTDVIVKQVAVVTSEGDTKVFTVCPPFPWQYLDSKSKRTNVWLRENLHSLKWEVGEIEYTEFPKVFQEHVGDNIIYVAGIEQKRIVRTLCTNDIVNLQEECNMPSLKKLRGLNIVSVTNTSFCNIACINASNMRKFHLNFRT